MVVQTLHRLSHSFDNPRLTRMAHYRGSSIEGIPPCEGAGVKGEAAGGGNGPWIAFRPKCRGNTRRQSGLRTPEMWKPLLFHTPGAK